jgi:hypothetical protein
LFLPRCHADAPALHSGHLESGDCESVCQGCFYFASFPADEPTVYSRQYNEATLQLIIQRAEHHQSPQEDRASRQRFKAMMDFSLCAGEQE